MKLQAMDGLSAVFSNGADQKRWYCEAEVHDLHTKIGQFTVEYTLTNCPIFRDHLPPQLEKGQPVSGRKLGILTPVKG